MRRAERLFLLASLLATPALAGAGPADLLQPRLDPSDAYTESFTFVADLEDGAYAWIQLSVSNLGPGTHHGVCRALLLRPGQAPAWSAQVRARPGKQADEWRYSEAGGLEVAGCQAQAGNTPSVSARFEGEGALSVHFERPFAPAQPPRAEVTLDAGRYRSELLQTGTQVRVVFQPAKGMAYTGRGGGYADHSHSTIPGRLLAQRWMRFRALRGERSSIVVRETARGASAPSYLWRQAEGFTELTAATLGREDTGWTAALQGEGWQGTVRAGRLLLRSAPIQELGLLGKMLKPLTGSPVTYTYRAQLERAGHPPLPGVMEVSLAEE